MDLDTKDMDYKAPLDKLDFDDDDDDELVIHTGGTDQGSGEIEGDGVEAMDTQSGGDGAVGGQEEGGKKNGNEILKEVMKDVRQLEGVTEKMGDLGPVEVNR